MPVDDARDKVNPTRECSCRQLRTVREVSRLLAHPASCLNSRVFTDAAVVKKVDDGTHRIIIASYPVRRLAWRECRPDQLLVAYLPPPDFAIVRVGDVITVSGRLCEEKTSGQPWTFVIIADRAALLSGEDQECRAFIALSHTADRLMDTSEK